VTGVERATLERLEDAITRRLDRIEGKVDGVAERVRRVELEQAAFHGAREEATSSGGRRLAQAGVALSIGMLLIGVPAAVWAVVSIVTTVGA